jgi:nucleoside-triphosphatase THEP1
MIEKNKGEEIVKQLGNPKRAKTLFALNKRIEICEKLIRDNKEELTPKDYEVIEEYKKEVAIQENYLTTEVKVMQLKNIKLPPRQFAQERNELLDKHQARHKKIIEGNHKENSEKNIQKNSEDIVRNEELNKEFDRMFPPITPSELAEIQRINSEQEQQQTLWSDGVHIPGIHPPVEKLNPIVYIDGQSFLTNQNISMIQASPGTGKSAICESILSNVLNKECEHIGLYVDESIERAVFFDCERDLSLIDESNERMLQRANVKEHNSKAIIVGLRKSFSLKLKKARIIQVIEYIKPQIILIDGIGDLVEDTNSIQETTVIYLWLIELITKYNLSVIVTLHPNKGKDTARGHIGSEMLRRCEGIIEVKENLEGIRTMSVTKARSSEKTKASFKWCKESKRMISCDVKQGNTKKPSIFNSLTEFDIEKLKQGIGFEIKHKPGEIVDIKERIVIGYSFTPLKNALQKYLREEHPGVNTGTNHIEIFIRDLCFENKHLLKSGKSGNSTYIFQNIVEEDIIVKSEEKE